MLTPNTNYQGSVEVTIGNKSYKVSRTTAKMAFYMDGDKEKRISLTKVNDDKSEKNHKLNKKKHIKPIKRLGLWGGHMPDAPESCSHPKKFYDEYSKTNWIDINICNGCKKNKGCSRFKEHKKSFKSIK